jgi:hypothetical protein
LVVMLQSLHGKDYLTIQVPINNFYVMNPFICDILHFLFFTCHFFCAITASIVR